MHTNRRQNQDSQGPICQMSKSKSPDNMREKIPAFRPKTLQQIFHESKCKKSTDKFEKKTSEKDKQFNAVTKQNNLKRQQKVTKNSLAEFIKDSGHNFDIESLEYQNSQMDQMYDDSDLNGYHSQQFRPSKRFQLRVLTPQCEPFSKLGKEANPFAHKDDSSIVISKQQKKISHWNGQITLATSMCQDDFDQLNEYDEIPDELKMFIDEKCFYVYCINSQNKNEYLLESEKSMGLKDLLDRILFMQNKNKKPEQIGKSLPAKTIKFLSASQIDEFLAPDTAHQFIQRQLNDKILPKKKYIELIYFVQAQSKPK